VVAHRHEARIRRRERHRLVDANLALALAEARRAVAGHGHDAVGRERLGQRDLTRGCAIGARFDRAEPEGQRTEVAARVVRAVVHAAASSFIATFGRQHAATHDALTAVLVEDLQGLALIDGASHVGCAIVGERQDAVVDRPECHLAGRRLARLIGDGQAHAGGVGRAVLLAVGGHVHRQFTRRIIDVEFGVSEPECRLARIAAVGARVLGRPATHEQHGDEDVGDVVLADRDLDGLLCGGQRETFVPADTFALDREQGRGRLPGRLNHHARGFAGFPRASLGFERDAVVVVPPPCRVTSAERVES
jgi:hypothetical protein